MCKANIIFCVWLDFWLKINIRNSIAIRAYVQSQSYFCDFESLFFVYLRSKIIFKFCYFGLFWTTNFSLLNNFSRKNFYHPRPQTAGPCQKDVGPHDPPPPANDPPWPAYWTSIAEKNDDQKPHRRVWHLHTPTPRTHYWTTKGEKQGEQDHEWEFNHLLGYKFES